MRRPRARPNVGLAFGRHGAPPGTHKVPAGSLLTIDGLEGTPISRIESAARAVTAAMERRKARVLARGLSAARRHPRRSADRRSVPFGLSRRGKLVPAKAGTRRPAPP